jgi:hypothetical protein
MALKEVPEVLIVEPLRAPRSEPSSITLLPAALPAWPRDDAQSPALSMCRCRFPVKEVEGLRGGGVLTPWPLLSPEAVPVSTSPGGRDLPSPCTQ